MTNYNDGTLTQVDGETNEAHAPIELGPNPCGITATGDALWIGLLGETSVARFDPTRGEITGRTPLDGAPWDVQAGHGSVWVAVQGPDEVVRIDPSDGSIVARIPVGGTLIGLAVTTTDVWVASRTDEVISRIDVASNEIVDQVEFEHSPFWFAVGAETFIVTFSDDMTAALVNSDTGEVVSTVAVGTQPRDPGFVDGRFWVANQGSRDVTVVDAADGTVLGSFIVPGATGIWTAEGLLGDGWVESFGGSQVQRFAPDAGLR